MVNKAKRGAAVDSSGLAKRLNDALAERDAALAQVADLRAQLDNARVMAQRVGERAPVAYPVSSGLGAPPLRYVLVDQANETVKTLLGPLHRAVKSLASGLKSS